MVAFDRRAQKYILSRMHLFNEEPCVALRDVMCGRKLVADT